MLSCFESFCVYGLLASPNLRSLHYYGLIWRHPQNQKTHNMLHRCQRRSQSRPQSYHELKISWSLHVWSLRYVSVQINRHTVTDMLIAILRDTTDGHIFRLIRLYIACLPCSKTRILIKKIINQSINQYICLLTHNTWYFSGTQAIQSQGR